jgi:redox-sensitive bicupin YhaK (pirin superfamily)
MSFFPAKDPIAGDVRSCDAIENVIVPRTVDVGGFSVRRGLPHASRRMVGPFIFFDHMGPAEFRSGQGMDVGRGIVHSERTAQDRRMAGERLHGLQCWVALPLTQEESEPGFVHYDATALPIVSDAGKTVRVVAGSLFGARSPVETLWDTVFAEVRLEPGTTLPLDADYEERAIYVIAGEIDIRGDRFSAGQLIVFRPGDRITVTAAGAAHVVIVGGAAMDGPRHIWWNFVSSRRDRIDQAKADWKAGRFDRVAGDSEFIPLPEG